MNGTIRYTIRPYDTIWMLAQVFNTTVDSIMALNPGIDPRNLQIGQVISLTPGFQYYETAPEQMMDGMEDDDMMMDLTSFMHMLWEQHVIWTRFAITALIHELPETDLVIQRLQRNATDFADAFAPFYGEETAGEFERLFLEHINLAAQLVQAAKAGDTETYNQLEQQWYENADQIAAFLADINPNWSEEDWNAMLEEHLGLLGANVENMIAGNYAESINGFDDVEAQALEMADMMAEGIAAQFPA